MFLPLKPGDGTRGIAIPVDGRVWRQRCLSTGDGVFRVTHRQYTELAVFAEKPRCSLETWPVFYLGVWCHIIISEKAGAVERQEVKRRLLGIAELGCLEVKFGSVCELLSGTASWKVPSLNWCGFLGKPNTFVIGLFASRRLTGRFAFPGVPAQPIYSLGSFAVARKSGRTYSITYAL